MANEGHTLVLGGGGVSGIAWQTGLIAGLSHHGVELHHAASFLGTSAGSTVGAQLTSGRGLGELYEAQLTGVPSEISKSLTPIDLARYVLASALPGSQRRAAARCGRLARAAQVGTVAERRAVIEQRLPGQDWPEADLRIVVVDAVTGEHRVLTRQDDVELVDAVAASCAVPMVWPPVELEGRLYMDGGMRSPVNLDLAPGTGAVVALVPLAMSFRRVGSMAAQRSTLGERPIGVVTPSAGVRRARGRNPLDASVVPAVARAGWEQAQHEVSRLSRMLHRIR